MMRKRICFVVAVSVTAKYFLKNHIDELSKLYDIYLVGNFNNNDTFNDLKIVEYKSIRICRKINIISDVKAILDLYKYFSRNKFDAVHSVTPKAGLLTACASKAAGIKHRIHIYTGQVWATRNGLIRIILKLSDKLISILNNHILVDGKSQRNFLIHHKILTKSKSKVLGNGSISGVDINLFSPSKTIRTNIRKELDISDDTIVYSYLGRLNKEKGIFELFKAFNELIKVCPKSYLLLIGTDEENCVNCIKDFPNIYDGINFRYYGKSDYPHITLQASDIFCLPSYREGFGISVIEAQSLAIPAICSDIYGLSDTILDNETGLKCKSKDWETLFIAMKKFHDNSDLIREYGENGRKRVTESFSSKYVTNEWIKFYKEIFDNR